MLVQRGSPQGAYFDRSTISSSHLLDQEAVAVGQQRSPVSTHTSTRPFTSYEVLKKGEQTISPPSLGKNPTVDARLFLVKALCRFSRS